MTETISDLVGEELLGTVEETAWRLIHDLLDPAIYGYWSFAWDGAKRRNGACDYRTMTITLSRPRTAARAWGDVMNTLLHEIAHVMTPNFYQPHGPEWQANARKLGIEPVACASDHVEVEYKWIATCGGCGVQSKLHRLTAARRLGHYSCAACCAGRPHDDWERFAFWYERQF